MRLLADLHTHTVASGHAFSTVGEIASAAAAKGLELVAITDHGPAVPGGAHLWHFWNSRTIPSVMSGVRVLKGCEANPVVDSDNGLDIPDEVLAALEFVAVGLHPECGYDGKDRVRNTEALVRAISHPLVDMITHPGNEEDFPVHLDAVIAAAVEHGVIVELNNFSFDERSGRHATRDREREFAQAACDAGAWIAIDSDAHIHTLVGEVSAAMAVAEEIGVPPERIVNRDAASVLEFLSARRARSWPASGSR
ncbi:MAG: phosphatase [Coriobacteriia bacterium]|nr:phosphatase [Coriobacteriia bacterium]MDI6843807.1 phosphatase [Anaerosomatales bacterium]GAV30957.1 probable phosphatase Teth39_0577 [Coriobacteriaceae bacterium EMTCatB1]